MAPKVILITGAAGGIGSATARALVARGHRVALVDVEEEGIERLAADLGSSATAITADVTSLSSMEDAVASTVGAFGRLDVVLANAGIEILGSVQSMTAVDVERVVDVDLLGVWRTVSAALPEIVRNRGYVAVVTSISGVTPGPFNAAYNTAKAGVVAFAKTLRLEVRPDGVAVGIVYFGYVDTATARRSVSHPAMAPIMAKMPKTAQRPVPVERAAAAIVRAIERRSARVVVPRALLVAVLLPEFVQSLTERWLGRDPIRWQD
jgi:NAD(P)-dependent dehydrogenase (short-subunit alcohol dehydrogenase family)